MTEVPFAEAKTSPLLRATMALCLAVAAYSVVVMVGALRGIGEEEAAIAVLRTCSARHMQVERAGRSYVCIDDAEWQAALRYAETGSAR